MDEKRYVWIPSEEEGWVTALLLNEEMEYFNVNYNDKVLRIKKDKAVLINKENSIVVPNLIQMPELHESIILSNLRKRYEEDSIYTFIGPMIISINPFKKLKIYDEQNLKLYESGQDDQNLPPHLFAVAQRAYSSLVEQSESQSLIISGESGAGKTEATKYILKYLSHVASNTKSTEQNDIANRIMATNPILEAFGNAKTQRNNNSSRFGKFIKISMSKDGKYLGASINNYLLEKTRVVFQAPTERNYHVFYQLLLGASPEERERYKLLERVEDYYYMSNGWVEVENIDDVQSFITLKNSFKELGIQEDEVRIYFTLLSAILLLGNVQFFGEDDVTIKEMSLIETIASLLQITTACLKEILTHRTIVTSVEKCRIPLRFDQAHENRDALAKALYSRIFDHLIKRCNDCIGEKETYDSLFIGVLDIYGFENLENNSLEQFCINYANEKLHQQFIENMFKAEQEQYTKEGVPWTSIDFVDNQACIHLIERPGGIMAMMDEEAKMPRGNDKTLMDKLSRKHRACPVFVFEDKFPDMFQVKHYASTVPYSIEGFMDKNKDTLQDDVSLAMVQSKLPLICELFTTNYDTPYPLSPRGSQPNLSRSQSSLDFKEISPPSSPFTNSGPKRPSSTLSRTATTGNIRRDSGRTVDSVSRLVVPQTNGRKSGFSLSLTGIENTGSPVSPRTPDMKGITVCRKFKYDLASLIEILASSNRHYIRCIKPNDYALPDTFDQLKIINQLRSNGILETVKLRQAGFSRRVPFTSFVDRYYVLGIQANQIAAFFNRPDLKETNNNKGGNDKIQWAIGKTQVFLRERFVQNLEKLRIKAYEKYVVVIQSTIKRQLSIQYLDKLKKEFQEKMERIVRIESRIRAWNATCAFMKLKMEDEAKRGVASVVLQKYIRYWNCQINKMKLMEKKGTNNGVAEEQRNNQIELKRKEQKRKMKEEEKNISLELLKIEQERSDMQLEKKRALEIERSKLEQNALLAAEEEKRRIIEEERRILQEERRKLEEERSKWTEEEKRREEMWRMEVQRQKDMYKQQELEQLEKKKIEINQLLEKEKSKLHKEELDLKNRHQLELQKLELERESLKGREEEMETKFKEEIELLRQEIMRVKEEANSAIKEQQLFNELERKHREEDWIRAQQEKLDIEKSKMMAQREEELRSQLHKLKAKKQKEKEKFAKERELQELQQAEWLKQQKSLIEEQFKQQQHQQVNTSLVSKESTLTDEFRSTYNLIGKGVFVGGIGLALWGLTTIVNIISPRGGSYPNK